MPNSYYNFTTAFIPGQKARSDALNNEYEGIEAGFDLLPSDVDSLTTNTATFAPETGAGNAYVVTMPTTRLSNTDGDEIVFFATHANTGAPTLNVDGIGAVSMVRADGGVIAAGDIGDGLCYAVRYDATNTRFQVMSVLTSDTGLGVSQTPWTSTINSTGFALTGLTGAAATPALAFGDNDSGFFEVSDDTLGVALLGTARMYFDGVGAQQGFNSATGGSFALRSQLVASGTVPTLLPNNNDENTGIGAAAADQLSLIAGGVEAARAEATQFTMGSFVFDTDQTVGAGQDNFVMTYDNTSGLVSLEAIASGGRVNTDINTATPPTTEAVTGNFEIYDLANDDELATFGYNASNELQIINNMRPATTTTTAMSFQIVGGTDNALITDKMVLTSNEFLVRQRSGTATYDLLKKDTDQLILYGANSATTSPGTNRILFGSRTGGIEGYVGYSGNTEFQVETYVEDVVMTIAGREAATRRLYLTGQANGTEGVKLYWPRGGDVVLETLGSGTTGYGVNVNEALYFDGRAAASTDITAKGQIYVSTVDDGLYYKFFGDTAVRLDGLFTSTEAGLVPLSGGGTSNFLRADGTWVAPAGGGNVSNTGTPANDQIAVWTNATTVEGTTGLTYDGTTLNVTGTVELDDSLSIDSTQPYISLRENDQAANSGNWLLYAQAGQVRWATANDASPLLANTATFAITRSGLTPGQVQFQNLSEGVKIQDGAWLRIQDAGDTDWLQMSHSGTDFSFAFTNTTSVDFTAATQYTFDDNLFVESGGAFRVYDAATNDHLSITHSNTFATISTAGTDTGAVPINIDHPVLFNYEVESSSEVITANAVTLTYSDGNSFELDLAAATANVTVTLSGTGATSGNYAPMIVKVLQDGTARTITWAGGTFVWLDGVAHVMNPTVTTGISIYVFETWDGGTTWYASGGDYP